MKKALKKVLVCALAAALTVSTADMAQAVTPSTSTGLQTVQQNDATADKTNGIVAVVDTKEDGSATFSGVETTTKKSVTVSSKVTVNGVSYTVTTIGAKAFANAKKATKVTLPATVKTISKNAFTGAKKLKTITLNSTKKRCI